MRTRIHIVAFICLMLLWSTGVEGAGGREAGAADRPVSTADVMTRIVSVTSAVVRDGARIAIAADGRMLGFEKSILPDPPRMVIDVQGNADKGRSRRFPVSCPGVDGLRVGFHPPYVRLVLDLTGSDVPRHHVALDGNRLVVHLTIGGLEGQPPPSEGTDHRKDDRAPVPDMGRHRHADPTEAVQAKKPPPAAQQEKAAAKPSIVDLNARLTRFPPTDGRPDTALYTRGLTAFNNREWAAAAADLSALVVQHADSPHAAAAHILLAKAFEAQNGAADSPEAHKAMAHYKKAVNRFPDAPFLYAAMLGLAGRYAAAGDKMEAVAYYNLIIHNDRRSLCALQALLHKADILLGLNRWEALTRTVQQLETRLNRWHESDGILDVKVEMARLLHDMSRFSASRRLLARLAADHPDYLRKRHQMALYAGYNAYELGAYAEARDHFFYAYNIDPRHPSRPFILVKIGETFRNEKKPLNAARVYLLTTDRFGDSEAAVIARIRLAELQQAGDLAQDPVLLSVVRESVGDPPTIYERVVNAAYAANAFSPLAQLAMIRLADWKRSQGKAHEGRFLVECLLQKRPWETMDPDVQGALTRLVAGLFAEKAQDGRSHELMHFYFSHPVLFNEMTSSEALLTVARSLRNAGFTEMSQPLVEKAQTLKAHVPESADMRFMLVGDAIRKGEYSTAVKHLDQLTAGRLSGVDRRRAGRMKADALRKMGQPDQALEVISTLRLPVEGACEQTEILLEKALLEKQLNRRRDLALTLQSLEVPMEVCRRHSLVFYQRLADLYLFMQRPERSLMVLEKALEKIEAEPARSMLAYKAAVCCQRMNRIKEGEDILRRIVEQADPLWRRLAAEKLDEIQFDETMAALRN